MLFYENRTLFFWKLGKMSQNVSSVAVVIGALRVFSIGKQQTVYFKSIGSATQSKGMARC